MDKDRKTQLGMGVRRDIRSLLQQRGSEITIAKLKQVHQRNDVGLPSGVKDSIEIRIIN